MYGGFFGFCIALFSCAFSLDPDWWWLLWASLIGLALEVCLRLGCGQPVADVLEVLSDLPDLPDIGGD